MTTSILAQKYASEAYRTYGQYVVGNRAVADYRDGLKPVQRRIVWAMYEDGQSNGNRFTKSANAVGQVISRYHPHGDASIYDALVGLVTCRYPLVHGQGNFGWLNDPPAAYRYTEAKLHANAKHMIGRDAGAIVKQDNFDGQHKEPIVFPAALPFLLLNGCSGIAVGILSEVPPHNLTEVVEACCAILEGTPTDEELFSIIKGPDYGPGSGILTSSAAQVAEVYTKGEGTLSFRCRYNYENENTLVITEFAPRFNLDKFTEKCDAFVEAGNLLSVTNNCSKSTGVRWVIHHQNPRFIHDHVLPLLETSVSYRFFVNETHENGEGATTLQLGLRSILERWCRFRVKTEKRIIKLEIERIDLQTDRLEAKKVGALNLKRIAEILSDPSVKDPETLLATKLQISPEWASIILDVPLRSLARLNVATIDKEIASLETKRAEAMQRFYAAKAEVVKQLRKIAADASPDSRGTVRQKRPVLDLPSDTDVQTYLAASRSGKIIRLDGSPEKRRASMAAWDQLICTGGYFWVVLASGQIQKIDVASMIVGKPKAFGQIAGIISSAATRIVVMDEAGEGLVIDASSLVKDKYKTLKTEHQVVRAFGMKAEDSLVAWNKKAVHTHTDLETTRVNSGGWKFLPKFRIGATDAVNLPAGNTPLKLTGGKLEKSDLTEPPGKLLGGEVYAELDDGTKLVVASKKLLQEVKGRTVVHALSVE